jgi:hypothetical protein
MSDPGWTGGWFDGDEAARRIGHYRWLELRLFEVLGGWVATVPELDVKQQLGVDSYHHAWHAELWRERLPTRAGHDAATLTRPANENMAAFMDELAAPQGREQTLDKLVGVYRVVLPHAIAAYSYHLRVASPVSDAPTIRSLTFVLQDDMIDWREGERLIQRHLRTPQDVEHAARRQAHLETRLVAAGGIAGPGSIGPLAP